MKDKGKAVAVSSSSNWFSDYYSSSDLPCRKHPSSSSVGICAYCLKDRLIKLVCSDCGEQRLSSCSCSDISSYTNSCTLDIGSVGRISFLIENDKDDIPHSNSHSNIKSFSENRSEATLLLKRSSSTSTSVDVKRGGFWKFGRLFRKKREKGIEFLERNGDGVVENMVSRSRSVGGFRSGVDDTEGGFTVSTGGASDHNKDGHAESGKKSGGFSGGIGSVTSGGKSGNLFESDVFGGVKRDGPSLVSESDFKCVKKGGYIEFDGDFSCGEDPGFIDLKLGFSSESKPKFSFHKSESGCRVSRDGDFSEHKSHSFDYLREGMLNSNGNSYRITVNEKDIKKCKKSYKVWRWIVKHNSSSAGRPSCKKDESVLKY